MKQKLNEKSIDRIDYEDDYDKITLRPILWEIVIEEKDSGEVLSVQDFEELKNAREYFQAEIKDAEERDEDLDDDETEKKLDSLEL